VDSWNRADGAAYGENYWPDAELVNPLVRSWTDAQPSPRNTLILGGIFKGSRMAAKVRRCEGSIQPHHRRLRYGAFQRPRAPARKPNQGNNVLRTHLKHILEKRNGHWKVLSAQNTSSPVNELTPRAAQDGPVRAPHIPGVLSAIPK